MSPTVRSMARPASDRATLLATGRSGSIAGWALVVGIGLYYFGPPPAAAFGTLLYVAAAWVRLDFALIAVVLLCPFYLPVAANPLPPRSVGALHFSLVEFAFVGASIAWVARTIVPPASGLRPVWPAFKAWFPPVAFVAAAGISAAISTERTVALRELRTVIIEPAAFALMLLSTLDRRGVDRLVGALLLLGGAVGVYSLYHYFVVGIVERTGGVQRVLAVYHSPNQLALLLDRLLPAAFAVALPLERERVVSWLRRFAPALVALLPMVAALWLTYSRGAWLAVAVSCLAAAAFRGRRLFAVALAVAAGAVAVTLTRLDPGRLISEHTSLQRPSIWRAGLRMALDHPIFGVGPDNFLTYYRDRGYLPPEAWAEPEISHPHNLILDTWLRTGALGLAAFWLALGLFARASWQVLRRGGTPSALALAAGMLAAMIHGLFDNGYFLIDLAFLFWAGFAAMMTLAARSEEISCAS